MSDDLLEPDDAGSLGDEDRREDVASEEAAEALEREDEAPGIEAPEHLGLTPPD